MKCLALLLTVSLAATASADPAADAQAQSAAGKKAFAEGKYADAIAAFRAANASQPDPKLLYAIAQAQRMAGDCAAAIVSYEEFIKTRSDDKLSEYSQANIDRCKELLSKEPVKDPVKDPIKEPVKDPVKDPISPRPTPMPPPPRDSGSSWTKDWVGHGLVAGGVVASVVGLVVWSGGRGDAAAVNDASDHAAFLDAQAAADGAVGKQRLGIGVALLGVAAIAGGVIHYKLSSNKEVMVTPMSNGGATVSARVRF